MLRLRSHVYGEGSHPDRPVWQHVLICKEEVSSGPAGVWFCVARALELQPVPAHQRPEPHVHGGSGRRGPTVSRCPANAATGGGVHGAGRLVWRSMYGWSAAAAAHCSVDTTWDCTGDSPKYLPMCGWRCGQFSASSPPRSPSWPS